MGDIVSTQPADNPAIVLANGFFKTPHAKTSHGLVRYSGRFQVVGVIDETCPGEDAGQCLDGVHRDIPIYESISAAMEQAKVQPRYAILGVATHGGVIPDSIRDQLMQCLHHRLNVVNGLHEFLSEQREFVDEAKKAGVKIIDVRKPKPRSELRFWDGQVLNIKTPTIAVLGTDCAIGKRTTARFLTNALSQRGTRVEMIYTGQTGWMQGGEYGIIFDSLPNDFVSGELEGAIVRCVSERNPDLLILEGQSSLQNPSGPCGAEFLLSGQAKGVILQHAPDRTYFDDLEYLNLRIGAVTTDIQLIRAYGADVLAITLHEQGLTSERVQEWKSRLFQETGVPVVAPLSEGVEALVAIAQQFAESRDSR